MQKLSWSKVVAHLKYQLDYIEANLRTIPRYFAFTNNLPPEVDNAWLANKKNTDNIAGHTFDEVVEEMKKAGRFKSLDSLRRR